MELCTLTFGADRGDVAQDINDILVATPHHERQRLRHYFIIAKTPIIRYRAASEYGTTFLLLVVLLLPRILQLPAQCCHLALQSLLLLSTLHLQVGHLRRLLPLHAVNPVMERSDSCLVLDIGLSLAGLHLPS